MKNCLVFKYRCNNSDQALYDMIFSSLICELEAKGFVCSEIEKGCLCKGFYAKKE